MSEEICIEDIAEFMDDLRATANRLLRLESGPGSVRPTALVITALKRSKRVNQDWSELTWENRDHFFRSMYWLMRHALTDHARRRHAAKRPPENLRVGPEELDLNDIPGVLEREPEHVLVVQEALEWLERQDDEAAQIVQHHYFTGATLPEIAQLLGCSPATVKRRLIAARTLLHRKINELRRNSPEIA
jgi:RNA polymerase sigma factor (TIGR02999 family)